MIPRLAVLGAGGWGGNWTERVLRDPDVEAVAFVDARPDVLQRLSDRGVPSDHLFDSVAQALNTVVPDAVTCSIPNPQRVPILRKVLERGLHILADKPLVHDPDTLRSLLEASRSRETVFMVAQNYRFFEGVVWLKKHLAEQTIGPVGSVHVHFQKEHPYVDACFLRDLSAHLPLGVEMSIHHYDMMRYLLNAEPLRLTAHGWRSPWSPGKGYTALDVHLDFPGGVHVAYDANWNARYDRTSWAGHWELSGENGALSYGNSSRSFARFDRESREIESEAGLDEQRDTQQSMNRVWSMFKTAIIKGESQDVEAPAFCPIEDNANSLGIAYAVGASIETGGTIDIPEFLHSQGLSV